MSDTAIQAPSAERSGPTALADASGALAQPLPADRFADRELSWLAFNERVLELAAGPVQPALDGAGGHAQHLAQLAHG